MNRKQFCCISLALVLLISSIVMVVLITSASAEAKFCAKCKKRIMGDAVLVDGKYFHKKCFRCSVCDKPITGPFQKYEGKYVDLTCYAKHYAPRCVYCREPIMGKFITNGDRVYHEECYVNHVAVRCVYCNQPIQGQYLENAWKQQVHAEHADKVKECDTCGRMIHPDKAHIYFDGRIQCEYCLKDEVKSLDDATGIVSHAMQILTKKGIQIKKPLNEIKIRIVNKQELKKLQKRADLFGYYHVNFETVNGKIVKEDTAIYFLNHLPHDVFLKVAAHELFHEWQQQNRLGNQNQLWREGSAEVASYLVLETLDTELAHVLRINLMKNTDTLYGNGFRKAFEYYSSNGLDKFLQKVKAELSEE